MDNTKKPGRGGKRLGAGRPVSNAPKRVRRAVEYFDYEWELIKAQAEKRGQSIREYLFSLVEADRQAVYGYPATH